MVRNWKLFRSAPASFRMDDRGVPSGPSKGPSLNGVEASNFRTFRLVGTYGGFRIKISWFHFFTYR